MEWEGYAAVHVYHDEVAVVLLPDPVDAQSIENFAKAVGIGQPSILKRMIDEGHVQTSIFKDPIIKVDQAYFTAEDAVAFEEGYTTPNGTLWLPAPEKFDRKMQIIIRAELAKQKRLNRG